MFYQIRIRWVAANLAGLLLCASVFGACRAEIVPGTGPSLIQPLIFNGEFSSDYPFVGMLLRRDRPGADWQSHCTLSLVGPTTALTAAHCVCPGFGSSCREGGRDAPNAANYRVFLQQAGAIEIRHFGIPFSFNFPMDDFALLHLAVPVRGIEPVSLGNVRPIVGTPGEIVGFGSTTDWAILTGIKRSGKVHVSSCGDGLDDQSFLCWVTDPDSEDANTCPGDSGAPLLVTDPAGSSLLVGIASGGYGACDGEDLSFDTAIAAHWAQIQALIGDAPLATSFGGEPIRAVASEGRFDGQTTVGLVSIVVADDDAAAILVVTANAAPNGGNQALLRVAFGRPPDSSDAICRSDEPGVFESCRIPYPQAGTWYAAYEQTGGAGGDYQLSGGVFREPCGLDIDADGHADALSDGLLYARFLLGFRGDALVHAEAGPLLAPRSVSDISAFLDSDSCIRELDIDGNGYRDAGTDALLLQRYLFGFRGAALIVGAIGTNADRSSAGEIEQWLWTLGH